MFKLAKLQELDYFYSKKISSILAMDSSIRKFFQIASLSGTAFMWIFGLIISYFIFPQYKNEILTIFIIFLVMLIPVFVIKHLIRRKRPDFKDTRMGTVFLDKFSFPSGHATRAVYATLMMSIFFTPSLTLIWIIWGVLMISSRLLLGVHYISDILGGMIIGGLSIFIIYLIGWLPIFPYLNYLPL